MRICWRARVQVLGLEMAGLIEPQPGAIHRHQEGAMLGMRSAHGEKPFQFGGAVDLRRGERPCG